MNDVRSVTRGRSTRPADRQVKGDFVELSRTRRSNCSSLMRLPVTSRQAIDAAQSRASHDGLSYQTLLGVTGSGKTFTMANVIAQLGRPAIVFAPNKTLAAQLYSEFREFFPKNAVEYFVSYYDYYQPEAYVPQRDTVHREGQLDQRAHRADAAVGHQEPAGAARRGDRGHRRARSTASATRATITRW